MEKEKRWYVVHIYSGYEKKVQTNLKKRIENTCMQDKIFKILIPEEEEIQVKDGVKKTIFKKVYPGYVLIEMIMTDDSWYIVRNTPGVTGFVGAGSKPVPLEDYEVEKIFKLMGIKKKFPRLDVNVEDKIQVTAGPFKDFIGTITAINMDKGKLYVLVSMFGRDTTLELDFDQIREIE